VPVEYNVDQGNCGVGGAGVAAGVGAKVGVGAGVVDDGDGDTVGDGVGGGSVVLVIGVRPTHTWAKLFRPICPLQPFPW